MNQAFHYPWVCFVGDSTSFANGKSTMTGESVVGICLYFWGEIRSPQNMCVCSGLHPSNTNPSCYWKWQNRNSAVAKKSCTILDGWHLINRLWIVAFTTYQLVQDFATIHSTIYQSVYGKICRHMDRAYPYGMMLAKATGEIVGGCPQFHAISMGKECHFLPPWNLVVFLKIVLAFNSDFFSFS